jgi:uncharacterized membrane protein YccC
MAAGGRADTRQRFLRRMLMIAAGLVLFALILFASGHWILGILIGLLAAGVVWVLLQTRTVH